MQAGGRKVDLRLAAGDHCVRLGSTLGGGHRRIALSGDAVRFKGTRIFNSTCAACGLGARDTLASQAPLRALSPPSRCCPARLQHCLSPGAEALPVESLLPSVRCQAHSSDSPQDAPRVRAEPLCSSSAWQRRSLAPARAPAVAAPAASAGRPRGPCARP
eukprot:scaffold97911_cov25-Tisochrysis_lutea.AAC.2